MWFFPTRQVWHMLSHKNVERVNNTDLSLYQQQWLVLMMSKKQWKLQKMKKNWQDDKQCYLSMKFIDSINFNRFVSYVFTPYWEFALWSILSSFQSPKQPIRFLWHHKFFHDKIDLNHFLKMVDKPWIGVLNEYDLIWSEWE